MHFLCQHIDWDVKHDHCYCLFYGQLGERERKTRRYRDSLHHLHDNKALNSQIGWKLIASVCMGWREPHGPEFEMKVGLCLAPCSFGWCLVDLHTFHNNSPEPINVLRALCTRVRKSRIRSIEWLWWYHSISSDSIEWLRFDGVVKIDEAWRVFDLFAWIELRFFYAGTRPFRRSRENNTHRHEQLLHRKKDAFLLLMI